MIKLIRQALNVIVQGKTRNPDLNPTLFVSGNMKPKNPYLSCFFILIDAGGNIISLEEYD